MDTNSATGETGRLLFRSRPIRDESDDLFVARLPCKLKHRKVNRRSLR
jgi:hypothetical protein